MANIPDVKLNNGFEIPVLGLGTWQGKPDVDKEVVRESVGNAIDLGYRLIDCAAVFGNERVVGEALQSKIKNGLDRNDLFVVSKLWCNRHEPELVESALKTTLENLQLDYLDMYLIQWPQGFDQSENTYQTGTHQYSDVDYVLTWKAMETVYRKGLTKCIGVSNFNSQQMNRLLNICTVFPQVNQVECHPYLNQKKLRQFCDKHGIVIMAYNPLGDPEDVDGVEECNILEDSTILDIAKRYRRTPAQILIKYSLQLGNVVIPKSSNKERLAENMNVFDFYLAPEDMSLINSLDCNRRLCRFNETRDHKYYPFRSDVEF